MSTTNIPVAILLALLGIAMVPSSRSLEFYASAAAAAAIIAITIWLACAYEWFRYALGYAAVLGLLAMAVIIIHNLPAYIPGGAP